MSMRQDRLAGKILAAATAAAILLPAWGLAQAADGAADPASGFGRKGFATVAKKAVDAVVSIRVERMLKGGLAVQESDLNDPFEFFDRFFGNRFQAPQHRQQTPRFGAPRQFKQQGQGSGFIITKDGYILTNHHVVGDADKIVVRLRDGREFTAKRIGTDKKSEVALVKIDCDDLPFLALGDSSKLEIGEWVIAVGNPFGLAETLTVGVVSAKGRSGMGIADYEDMIQTDAAINPGNSGGPLLDIDGKVIGINTAIFSRDGCYMGIGFATPINMARAIKDQLLTSGRVVRGYLGIAIQDFNSELAEQFGAKDQTGILVTEVARSSPAEKAGLQEEDVILKLDDNDVESVGAFRNTIASATPGTAVALTILRDGTRKAIKAVCGTLPDDSTVPALHGEESAGSLGLSIRELTHDIATRLGDSTGEGVLVNSVDPSGLAAANGIEAGDLIASVNRKPVRTVDDFKAAIADFGSSKSALLKVKNDKGTRFVVISAK
ncbi:MAG: DegQ family serine endoprotease [bacterium]